MMILKSELEGFKRKDLKRCGICDRGLMHAGDIVFYRMSIQQFIILPGAVLRQHHLDAMVGSPQIGHTLGPDEDLAKAPFPPDSFLVCLTCAMHSNLPIAFLAQKISEREDKESL